MLRDEPQVAGIQGVGTCLAWANLFSEVLKSQGVVDGQICQVTPSNDFAASDRGFFVRNWSFAQTLLSGPDGRLDSVPHPDDKSVCTLGAGSPRSVCVTDGPNRKLETFPNAADDLRFGIIEAGENGECDTAGPPGGDDEIVTPVGSSQPNLPCVFPGADGVLNTAPMLGDQVVDGQSGVVSRDIRYSHVLFTEESRGQGVDTGDIVDIVGVPGQVTLNPTAIFSNHFVVKWSGSVYDPSYGIGGMSESEHEEAAVAALVATFPFDGRDVVHARRNGPEKDLKYCIYPKTSEVCKPCP